MAAVPETMAAGTQQGNAVQGAARSRFERALAEVRFDEPQWSARSRAADPDALAALMLAAKPAHAIDPAQGRLASIRQLALDPVYQLK